MVLVDTPVFWICARDDDLDQDLGRAWLRDRNVVNGYIEGVAVVVAMDEGFFHRVLIVLAELGCSGASYTV